MKYKLAQSWRIDYSEKNLQICSSADILFFCFLTCRIFQISEVFVLNEIHNIEEICRQVLHFESMET